MTEYQIIERNETLSEVEGLRADEMLFVYDPSLNSGPPLRDLNFQIDLEIVMVWGIGPEYGSFPFLPLRVRMTF